jgi:hypothetical protein
MDHFEGVTQKDKLLWEQEIPTYKIITNTFTSYRSISDVHSTIRGYYSEQAPGTVSQTILDYLDRAQGLEVALLGALETYVKHHYAPHWEAALKPIDQVIAKNNSDTKEISDTLVTMGNAYHTEFDTLRLELKQTWEDFKMSVLNPLFTTQDIEDTSVLSFGGGHDDAYKEYLARMVYIPARCDELLKKILQKMSDDNQEVGIKVTNFREIQALTKKAELTKGLAKDIIDGIENINQLLGQ